MKIFTKSYPWQEPAELFKCFANLDGSLFFDSADQTHPDSRMSYIAFAPLETIRSKNGRLSVSNKEFSLTFRGDAFVTIEERLQNWGFCETPHKKAKMFQGGAAGYFGYDLSRQIEKLPATANDNPTLPDMAIGLYDMVLQCDHHKKTLTLVIQADDKENARDKEKRFEEMFNKTPPSASYSNPDWHCEDDLQTFYGKVQRTIDYILAGDIFQANIARRFTAQLPENFDAYAHYQNLRSVNPAPFAAFMNFGTVKLSSASPERFLKLKDRLIETCPIKGTRSKGDSSAEDLAGCEKNRAENIMIVDLLRNDLSKVCETNSIKVDSLCAIESFAGLHHMVSRVSGKLSVDVVALDALRACFPGGSITGAPKIRAMEIIEQLEQTRRGPYCGAMGYISSTGDMDTNITIRTLVYDSDTVSFHAGGGITALSNPQDEYQETMIKARKIFESFETPVHTVKEVRRAA